LFSCPFFCFVLCCFVLCFETSAHYVVQFGLNLYVLLPQYLSAGIIGM
jgi:hypothetical protein